jgi:hypothetical protein
VILGGDFTGSNTNSQTFWSGMKQHGYVDAASASFGEGTAEDRFQLAGE